MANITEDFLNCIRVERSHYKLNERDIAICKMRLNGHSYPEIAKVFNLSPERLRQIYVKYNRLARHPKYKGKFVS